MTEADLSDVERIEYLAYSEELAEPIAVLAAKFRLAPALCFVARVDSMTVGYAIAHPWDRHSSPGLGVELSALPATREVVHIHDLALDPAYGGRGIARQLFDVLLNSAREQGFEELTLVAVQGAQMFWERMGFEVAGAAAGYDSQAVFMRRP
ncbi:MAG: GNAT family N-acetyltransferase [Bradymonadaceae bacterium]|nr:GNAT family N-acetyltransferase [Lujinxingiaceae bacterium]